MRIGDHNLGTELEHFPQRFGGVPRLGHDFHVRFILQQPPQSLA
jgi:hypothetical protein